MQKLFQQLKSSDLCWLNPMVMLVRQQKAMNNWTAVKKKTPKDDKKNSEYFRESLQHPLQQPLLRLLQTLPPSDISTNNEASYGYTPSVSLTTNQIANVFKSEDSTLYVSSLYK